MESRMDTGRSRELLKVLSEVDLLATSIMCGGYSHADAETLRSIITKCATKFATHPREISRHGGPSIAVVSSFMCGSTPRFNNFVSIVSTLRKYIAELLVDSGVLSPISLRSGSIGIWINYDIYTSRGKLINTIEALEKFKEEFAGINSDDDIMTFSLRKELIDILEMILGQLRSGVAERGVVVEGAGRLKKVSGWASSKFFGKGLEKLAEFAIDGLKGLI